MKTNIGFESVRITDGFWKRKQDMIRETTIFSVYNRFYDTGRIESIKCIPDQPAVRHYFWDSDVAKWIESVAYLVEKSPNADLERMADAVIDDIAANQRESGYFNSYFQTVATDQVYAVRKNHELYCAGHLIEAAIAYKHATGKDLLYRCMLKFADEIHRVFFVEKSAAFFTPGHQEIELALVKLWRESGEERYLELAQYFLDARGTQEERDLVGMKPEQYHYAQDHLPVREQLTAEGHAVRLLYMCCAMADLAHLRQDESLRNACEHIFNDIAENKMYITGGLGSNSNFEGFEEPFHLPNEIAYNETCASIAICMLARRMQLLSDSSRYADMIERQIYNGMLSGLSLDGRSFFYENPLEIDLMAPKHLSGNRQKIHYPARQRVEVFSCSCCPPNLTRFIPALGEYLYTVDRDVIRVQQYMDSEARWEGLRLVQKTDYPRTGDVEFHYEGRASVVGFRIPAWCTSYTLAYNGRQIEGREEDGYVYLPMDNHDCVQLHMDMPVVFLEANPAIRADAGKCAVMRGPVVYCAEQVDNGDLRLFDFRVSEEGADLEESEIFYFPTIRVKGEVREDGAGLYAGARYRRKEATLKLIPYYCFANRGESNMSVWMLQK